MRRVLSLITIAVFLSIVGVETTQGQSQATTPRPHIVFVMADDMGWGQTGYRNHPVLKTPNLDAMAAGGLRFERFYAGCPVCSPTRASVLTGRANDRTGVQSHGFALRLQEKTIAQALKTAGYTTGHFGKWHLNGLRGPGAPVLGDDPRNPGKFGFDDWVSVTNFFDLNPLMSRGGKIEEFQGDSSEIAVAEAIKFFERHRPENKPLFAVIWFGTPHSPFRALPDDKAQFAQLDDASASHYGELIAMDRAVGTLRSKLRELAMADDTLLVFCSDNGGLSGIKPETVGGLRGNKGTVFEGGLRVPGIIEWPAMIRPRVTNYPACTMDLFPTVADVLDLPADVLTQPIDGVSLRPLFKEEIARREKPIPFRYQGQAALIDNRYKLVSNDLRQDRFELYDLESDPTESKNLAESEPEVFNRLRREFATWNDGVEHSVAGKDYAAGRVEPPDPKPISWTESPAYRSYLDEWQKRPEYRRYAKPTRAAKP